MFYFIKLFSMGSEEYTFFEDPDFGFEIVDKYSETFPSLTNSNVTNKNKVITLGEYQKNLDNDLKKYKESVDKQNILDLLETQINNNLYNEMINDETYDWPGPIHMPAGMKPKKNWNWNYNNSYNSHFSRNSKNKNNKINNLKNVKHAYDSVFTVLENEMENYRFYNSKKQLNKNSNEHSNEHSNQYQNVLSALQQNRKLVTKVKQANRHLKKQESSYNKKLNDKERKRNFDQKYLET